MAFGTKYRATWNVEIPNSGPFYRSWTADLKKEAGAGATALTTSDTPCRITLTKEDPLTPYGIGRTSCVLEVVGEDTAFDEIRAAGPKAWTLNVTGASTNVFVGYVEPWRMRKVVGPGPVVQQIVATDGLDYLKSINWYDTAAAARTAGFQNPLEIVERILNDNLPYDAASGYGFQTSANWYAYGSEVVGWAGIAPTPTDPLLSYAHDVGALWSALGGDDQSGRIPTAYEALEHILAVWQLYLTWGLNRWHIRQVAHYDSDASGAYYWTYSNALAQSGEGYSAAAHMEWEGTNVALDGSRYVVEQGPQYRKAVVTYEHKTTAGQLLSAFWTNATFNWTKSDASLTATQATFPELRQQGISNIPTLQLTPIASGTETARASLLGPLDVRTDFLAIVANAGTPLYVTDSSIYDIDGTAGFEGNTNSITFNTSAYYAVTVEQGISTYYVAGWAIGIDDGTVEYWLKTDGTWTNVGGPGTGPGDDEIWTQIVAGSWAGSEPTLIGTGPVQLPAGTSDALFTVHVRLYQGFDPYYAYNSSASTVSAFGWGETVLGLLVDGSPEVGAFEITVENTGSGSVHRLDQTLFTGTGPNADSPLRIALDSAPFNGVVYDSWNTDSGVTGTGTDTQYTHAELWGRELLKMYGTAPEILRAKVRILKAAEETITWEDYIKLSGEHYYLTNGTLEATKEGMTLDFVGVQIRQDSLTITTAELNPNPWPPILPMVPDTWADDSTGGEDNGGSTGGTYTDVHPCTIAVYDCKPGANNTILYDRLDGLYNGTLGTGMSFDAYGLVSNNGYATLPLDVFNATSPSKMTVLFAVGDEDAASFFDNDYNIFNVEHSSTTTMKIEIVSGSTARNIQIQGLGGINDLQLIVGTQTLLGAFAITPSVSTSRNLPWATISTSSPRLYALSNRYPGPLSWEDASGLTDHTWPTSAPDFVRVCESSGASKFGKLLWLEIIHCHLDWHDIKPQLDRIRRHIEARSIPGDSDWEGVEESKLLQPPILAQPPGTTCILAPSTGSWVDDATLHTVMGSVDTGSSASGYARDTLGFASGTLHGGGSEVWTIKQRGLELTGGQGWIEVPGDVTRNGQFTLVHVVGGPGTSEPMAVVLNQFDVTAGGTLGVNGNSGYLEIDMGVPGTGITIDLYSREANVPSAPTQHTHVSSTVFANLYDWQEPTLVVFRLDIDAKFCDLTIINNTVDADGSYAGATAVTGNLWDPATTWTQTGDENIPWHSVQVQQGAQGRIFQYFSTHERILTDQETEEMYLALRPWLIQTRGFGESELPINP